MIITGLQKTTLLDYPGHVAATVFTGGCNFRCPFCHNMNIVEECTGFQPVSEEEIMKFLDKRKGIIDGICITGGEPTLQKDLYDFIRKVKEKEYLIKLDTNGTNVEIVKKLIEENLVDYVAMDIKSGIQNYETVAGISSLDIKTQQILMDNIRETVELLKQESVNYEFRTTLVKEYHNENVMKEIGKLIKNAERYYLQNFVDSEYVPNHSLTAFSKEEVESLKDIVSDYVENVYIRGID